VWVAAGLGFGWALEAAIATVNWIVTHTIKPKSLPRMDFSEGIPPGNRTMVVVPTLLESEHELDHLLQELELYFLSNRDPQLTYALLTDFGDAPAQTMPEDEPLLSRARSGLEALNQKYPDARPFYLFHRQREWNPSEGVWMGWERKRGKLAQFNRMLLDHGETSYIIHDGDLSILPEIRYVITLDADTSLPQGSASRLIATLVHPMNRAEFAADGRSVIAGYTVLQPRVAIKPTSANRSLFSQIYSGNVGFDLYSFAVSDVYQDLFGEGSYVGKGIYDVAAFERSLAGMVRENTLLSHDLFEGIYGRAALVTDVTLYEEYPSGYLIYARRLRRWIRGDWQLLPWLSAVVHTANGSMPNRLSVISRWKILDNLRRSLLPPNLLALLAASWLILPGSPVVLTLLVLLPSLLPVAAPILQYAVHNMGRLPLAQLFEPARLPLLRWALGLVLLPYEALIMLGAIATTLQRLLVARSHLLQWTTAARAARTWGTTLRNEIWRQMAAPFLVSLFLGAGIAILRPLAVLAAAPLLIAWLVSPEIAYRVSQPRRHQSPPLSQAQRRQVRRLARRTWAFFERFAGPDDQWLPPDHYQALPRGSVAHYTTPTNIGMLLLSTLSAHDLGYIGPLELVVRLRSTFETMGKLERYRGHLLNWYDSQTLAPLPPHYVSTVDSGNLAACLISLRQGCLAMRNEPVLDSKQWRGLLVILDILGEVLQASGKENPDAPLQAFEADLADIYEHIDSTQEQPERWLATLTWLSRTVEERIARDLLELLHDHADLDAKSLGELNLYLDLLRHHMQDMQRNISLFAPWLNRLQELPAQMLETPGWQAFRDSLPAEMPALGDATLAYDAIKVALDDLRVQLQDEALCAWCQQLEIDLSSVRLAVTPLLIALQDLADQADAFVRGMDFRFLFDDQRQVFHIGYNASTQRLDSSFYDLLASEARVASLIAIAKGDVSQSHWQHLGRPVTRVNGKQALLSWSGTMFEYLMPTLFTRNYSGTFLADSCYAALAAQADYGQKKRVAWGISESGYYAFDANMNYQYRAFGVPDLGYKRDLPDDLVVAPYASLMGLSLEPRAVVENMTHLDKLGMLGRFGYYEAIDYTRTRLPLDQEYAIVKSYMAHHQGMILLAVCNYLADNVMVRRFHADERIQSVELLLQEKIPENPPIEFPHPDEPLDIPQRERSVDSAPWHVPADSLIPLVHVLSRADTSVMVTNAGGGYSQWREFALTRWQADTTLDDWGTWIYVQDCESGALWSATCQPMGCPRERQDVTFYPHKAEFRRSDRGISLRTEIVVGDGGIEIRRVTLLNDSDRPRRLRLVSYGEVVLAPQATDRRHPAFNKLFVESEYHSKLNALLFRRRTRSEEEKPVFLAHALIAEAGRRVTGEHESDRALFLGRSGTVHDPLALRHPKQTLSGSVGGTLDPIFSLAQEIDLKPHTRTRVTFLSAAAPSRREVLDILARHQSHEEISRAFDMARARSERELLELGLNAGAVQNIQRLLSALLYPAAPLRGAAEALAKNQKGQSGLWAFGISGDYPMG
jgi:cyclic beta-1,2-glucan synthetase